VLGMTEEVTAPTGLPTARESAFAAPRRRNPLSAPPKRGGTGAPTTEVRRSPAFAMGYTLTGLETVPLSLGG
jgi:hypothetical protein